MRAYVFFSFNVVDYLGILKAFLLSEGIINSLETAGIFRWYTQRPTFIIKPGAVQLPLPGAFQSADGYVIME